MEIFFGDGGERNKRGEVGSLHATISFRDFDRGERIISWELGVARDAATNFSYPPAPLTPAAG